MDVSEEGIEALLLEIGCDVSANVIAMYMNQNTHTTPIPHFERVPLKYCNIDVFQGVRDYISRPLDNIFSESIQT